MEVFMRKIEATLGQVLRRGALLVLSGVLVGLGLSVSDKLAAAKPGQASLEANREIARLGGRVEELEGRVAVTDLKIDRLTRIQQYSSAYRIPANQAATIYDAAIAEGLHPSLGYQLVKVESGFRPAAQSSRNALGLTQVRLATAREVDPAITSRTLLAPETNLRIGFRVLKRLLRQFDNDLELALRAYNLGPTGALMSFADTTSNAKAAAYAEKVMKGVKPGPTKPSTGELTAMAPEPTP
jgi:soluble lytic murein transglycosylase-like protein